MNLASFGTAMALQIRRKSPERHIINGLAELLLGYGLLGRSGLLEIAYPAAFPKSQAGSTILSLFVHGHEFHIFFDKNAS